MKRIISCHCEEPKATKQSFIKDCFASLAMTLISFLFLFISLSFATTPPPTGGGMTVVTSMTLTYDLDKATLHVEAVHPSDNLEKNFVRMMTVSLNGQLFSTLNYVRQNDFAGFSDDVSIKAQAGDVITVELFCTGGSSISKDLTVAKSGTVSSDQNTDASTDNSTTDNTAN